MATVNARVCGPRPRRLASQTTVGPSHAEAKALSRSLEGEWGSAFSARSEVQDQNLRIEFGHWVHRKFRLMVWATMLFHSRVSDTSRTSRARIGLTARAAPSGEQLFSDSPRIPPATAGRRGNLEGMSCLILPVLLRCFFGMRCVSSTGVCMRGRCTVES